MNRKLFVVTIAAAAIFGSLGLPERGQAGPIDLSVQLSAYLPAPPGVSVHIEAGRPYYIENNRRVYLKEKDDNGRHRGHDKERKKGHGKNKHD